MSGAPAGHADASQAGSSGSPRAAVRLPRAVCPHLAVVGDRWRHAGPSRDHRCAALRPAGPLTTDKQRRLCLVAAHVTCPAYLAAHDARLEWPGPEGSRRAAGAQADSRFVATAPGVPMVSRPNRWALLRMGPVVAAPDAGPTALDLRRHRAAGRVALVGMLVVAFLAVLASRPPADHQPGALLVPMASAAPSVAATPTPTPAVTLAATPAALRTNPSTVLPTVTASLAPPTQRVLVYTVVSGDTLSGIAGRYGTTVQAIMDLNSLTSTNLRIGQQLKIPQPAPSAASSPGPAP